MCQAPPDLLSLLGCRVTVRPSLRQRPSIYPASRYRAQDALVVLTKHQK
jgi:hypothetical protein